ncbi:MFS transporter [uncultured Clostridium sp.]|jgi:EmrB/QacA subfamily drug resistance transporter|uniref:MFS transporter n=1 Tax=uncultured Clostridium sp. TaxID=59620 RepID=UPI002612C1E3|nr:MFS transporter [uncultured Clostridium sp.]
MLTKEEIYNKRWFILFSVGIVTFMSTLDASIVNVALPVISKDLSVSMSTVQWTVTTYLIVISGLLLTFGRLGDLKGKTNVFRVGIIIFTIGSLLCGISNSITMLIISRAVQGLGAACTMANSQGIVTSVFPGNERGKALGVIGLLVALGTMVGPAVGGIISDFKWEYIFLINIPIGIIASILSFKLLPNIHVPVKEGSKLDFIGTILFILTIVPLIISITEGSIYGFTDTKVLIGFAIAFVAFILFIISQKKLASPLLDFSILKNHQFSKGILSSLIAFTTISSYSILLPFYYESVRGISPIYSGFLMIVFPIALTITGPLSGSLSDKIRKEILPLIGFIVSAIGFALMATISATTPLYLIIIYLLIMGAGSGLFQSPMNSIVMSAVDKTKLGVAGSLNALVRNLGMIIGITFGTSLLYKLMSNKLGFTVTGFVPGHPSIFVSSMNIVFIIAAVLCIIGAFVVLSIMLTNNKKLQEAK